MGRRLAIEAPTPQQLIDELTSAREGGTLEPLLIMARNFGDSVLDPRRQAERESRSGERDVPRRTDALPLGD